jgi:long-chain acyl-CoA synthetase
MDEAEVGSPEFWARQTPDAIAVVNGDRKMTYAEWDDRANRVADALARVGLGPGDRIGMRFRLDFSWFLIHRALQKLSVELVAVNWRLTPAEALYILSDSDARGLACDDANADAWGNHDVGLLITVGQVPGGPGVRLEDLIAQGDPTQRFGSNAGHLVLYTSGTTGRPKGVPTADLSSVVDMERLARYGTALASEPPVPAGPVVMLLTLPVHHAAGSALAARTWGAGGTAVLLDPFDPEEALRLIARHRVQFWMAVPTMLLRVQALPLAVIDRYDLSSLTSLATGAAPVPQSLKEWIVDRFGPDILWEGYGCSEAGMISYITPQDQLRKPGSSGRAYDGVEIAIVDETWSRLPVGATGEIAVNTPIPFTGYLGREPLGRDIINDGYYRTGDVGHLDQDGFLYITDRAKDMIVAGGVNIYPAEIEKAIIEHPDVEDCAVIGIPEEVFGEQPMAFIVARSGRRISTDDILAFLDGRLASYKKPRVIEFMEALPVSPMGKVLKTELRQPYWKGRDRNV